MTLKGANVALKAISIETIKALVHDVPDFPKKGIIFKDITPVLAMPGMLSWICAELAKPFENKGVSKVLAIESRGFFFGTGVAEKLGAGLVPVRKAGKLPRNTIRESYALEYGEATLEMHFDAIDKGEKVLIVDDVLATGGTIRATKTLAEKLGGQIVGSACFIELGFLNGRKVLEPTSTHSLWVI